MINAWDITKEQKHDIAFYAYGWPFNRRELIDWEVRLLDTGEAIVELKCSVNLSKEEVAEAIGDEAGRDGE